MSLRVVTLDIETVPNIAHVWGLFKQNVALNQIVDVGHVTCFAAKWQGTKEVEFYSEHHDGMKAMVRHARRLMDEADAVVTYNGVGFDMPHLRREILLAGLAPPSPHRDIDLYLTVARRFRFASNKLAHVAQELGLGGKASTGGHELWVKCMAGDEAAWAKMKRYCVQDVRLTEALYERLLPWIPNHPHPGLYGDDGCSRCGGTSLERRGFAYTPAGKYQRVMCRDCGAWMREGKTLAHVKTRSVS